MLLTPYGLLEAWKLFPGDELLDGDGNVFTIESMSEQDKTISKISVEDETSLHISKDYLDRTNLNVGSDLLNNKPFYIKKLEEAQVNLEPFTPSDGIEFGTFAKYLNIPFYYTLNTIENRKVLFQGLLFSQSLESYTDDNRVIFLNKYGSFAEDVLYLVRSLGGTGFYHKFYHEGDYYELDIQLPSYFNEGTPTRRIVEIEELETEKVLTIKSNQKHFIVNDFLKITNKDVENEQKDFN